MGLPLSWGVYKNRNEMEGLEAYKNKSKGNPYHDKLGRFTTGPGGGASGSGSGKSSKKGQSLSSSEIDKKIEEATRRLYDIQDELTAEEDFGGDTSHLLSLEQEAKEELRQLKKQKSAETRGEKGDSFSSKYKVGDTYRKGGEVFEVQEGENGPMGVSKDGKIVTELPDKLRHDQTKTVEEMFDGLRDEGVPMDSPRYQAAIDTYDRIQKKASGTVKKGLEASEAPKMVKEEVERFLKQVEATGSSKSVESYYKTAKGVLDGWSKGNGGTSKSQSSGVKEEVAELKAELDSLYDRYRAMTTQKSFREW